MLKIASDITSGSSVTQKAERIASWDTVRCALLCAEHVSKCRSSYCIVYYSVTSFSRRSLEYSWEHLSCHSFRITQTHPLYFRIFILKKETVGFTYSVMALAPPTSPRMLVRCRGDTHWHALLFKSCHATTAVHFQCEAPICSCPFKALNLWNETHPTLQLSVGLYEYILHRIIAMLYKNHHLSKKKHETLKFV